jgi:hypothetical protein
MSSVLRPVLGAGACVLALCALNYFDQASLGSFDRDETARAGQRVDVDFEAERSAVLDERLARMHQVIELKQSIVRDFVAGSVSLHDAGSQFRDLEKITPGANVQILRTFYPGASSDEERYCRQVIQRALRLNRLDSVEEEKLRQRLEDQFKRDFSSARLVWVE